MKRPAFQFYPGDWQRDAALRSCSVGARGLWIEMICIMHQADPYGHLALNGKPISSDTLARMVGASKRETAAWIGELEGSGVCSRDGELIVSRRMVRDEIVRKARAEGGKLGGNPDLGVNYNVPGYVYVMARADGQIKIGISTAPEKRAYRIRRAINDESVKVIAKGLVDDMGAYEEKLHKKYAQYSSGGEWFILPSQEQESLIHLVNNLKVNGKVNTTPSVFSLQSSGSKSKEAAAPPPDPLWGEGLEVLTKANVPIESARTFVGKCLKDWTADAVLDALREAKGTADPRAYTTRLLQAKPRKQGRENDYTRGSV